MKLTPEGPERKAVLLAILAGALAALGQAPLNLWMVSLPAFGFVFWQACGARTSRQVARIGWGAGFGYFAVALSWIVEPFLVDLARHGWMAPFAIVFLSGGLALLWGLAFWLSARFFSHRVLALIVIWTATEALRGVLFTGFPWALIGHIWIDSPVRLLSSVTGPHGLTLLVLLIAGLPFAMRQRWVGGVLSLIVGVVAFGYGALTISGTQISVTGKTVRLIQPNAEQHLKWDPAHIPIFFSRQVKMMQAPGAVDLMVWPESALASRLDFAQDPLAIMAEAANGTPVAFGVNDFVPSKDGETGTYRNALAVLKPDGTVGTPYHKHHLVPFGEYIPLGELAALLGIRGLAVRDGGGFSAGAGPALIDIPGIGPVLPLICYELIFPRHLRTAERPKLILQVTNDAWFGNISGPYQHLAQARLRAVEQGLPVLRAANTGVSSVIDPLGRIIRQIPLNEAGYLDEFIPAPLPATFYARYGDTPIFILLVVALLGTGTLGRSKKD